MVACERAIVAAGFRTVEIIATLAGEALYASFGYEVVERYEIAMTNGLSLPVVRMSRSVEKGHFRHAEARLDHEPAVEFGASS